MFKSAFILAVAFLSVGTSIGVAGERPAFDFRYHGGGLVSQGTFEEMLELGKGGQVEKQDGAYLLSGKGRQIYTLRLPVEQNAEYLFRIKVRSADQFVCRIGQLSMAYNDLGEWQVVTGLYRNNDATTAELTLNLAPLDHRAEAKAEIADISMVRVERPTVTQRRSLSGATPLVEAGKSTATIVIPASLPSYQEWAGKIVDAVREKTGVSLEIVFDTAITESDYPILKQSYRGAHLIVLGRLGNNRAFWPAYNQFFTAVDGYYPGGDGYAVHTATNLFHLGGNHLLVGGTSDEGVRRGVEKLLEKIVAQAEGKSLSLPWLLEVDLRGESLAFFKADNARWEEVPENGALPKREPGYGNIVRWYQNAMGYYWTGWDSYRQRAEKELERVLEEHAITHHYIVEFFIRTYEMLHASGVLSPEQVAKADGLITANFLDFLTVSDLGWMTTFAPPYGQVNLVNRHQVAPWIADLKMAELVSEVMTPEGGMKDLAEFRRWEKERAFRDFVAHRSGPNLPGGVTPSACEEIIATFFRFALERDLYREFFASGNAMDALTLERINPVTGQYILPSGIRDTRLLLGMMASLTGSPEMKWLWTNLPESVHVRGHFQGRYLGEVRRYTPDAALPEKEPEQWLGIRVGPNPVNNSQIRSNHRDYYFLSYRSDFSPDADYVAFNGVNYTEPAGTVPVLISNGISWLSGQDGGGRFDLNSVTAVRTDAGDGRLPKGTDQLSQSLWNSTTSEGTAMRLRQTLTSELIWTRDFIVLGKGLFVFRDEFKAFKAGDYSLNVNWQPIGQVSLKGDRASLIVRNGRMEMSLLGDGFAPDLSGEAGKHGLRNQALRRLEAGESAVSYTVIETHKSHAAPFRAVEANAMGLTLRNAGEETQIAWRPGEWNGVKSDAELVIASPRAVAFHQAKTLESQGKSLVSLPKAGSFSLNRAGEWSGLDEGVNGDGQLFAALSKGVAGALKSDEAVAGGELQMVTKNGASSLLWNYEGMLRPAQITGYRTLEDGTIDFGKVVQLSEIRTRWTQAIWSAAVLPEKLLLATERSGEDFNWTPAVGEKHWRPGVRTANYGEVHPVEQVDEAIILKSVPARYVKTEPPAALAFFTADQRKARHPVRVEVGDFTGQGTSHILVVSDVFPQFPRAVRDDDVSVAVLDEKGSTLFQREFSGPVQGVRLLDRNGRGEKELFVLYANGTLEVYGLDGKQRGKVDLYAMHQEFNRTEGKGNTRAPAGGYVLPFSIGTWQPDAEGRRKLVIGRYGGFTFLNHDLSFEGVLNVSGYATPGLLERGVDFGEGGDEQVVAERLRFWHLGGSDRPTVRDRAGASYWPQVYQLLKTIPEDEASKVPLGGMPIKRYELLEKASSQPRYALLARGTSLSLYDGKARGIGYSWSAPAAIVDVAITHQSPGNLSLAIATADGLLWQMRWEQGLEQPPVMSALRFPDKIRALREAPGDRVLIAGEQGIYLMPAGQSVIRIAEGDFQSVAPLGQRIIAVTADGAVRCLQPAL